MSDPKIGEWETVEPSADSGKIGEWQPVPQNTPPNWADKAGAVAYGLGTSTLGTLGDAEKFLNPDEKKHEKFLGRETVFPTTQEAQKGYEAIGIPHPKKGTEKYQTAGEIAPMVVGGGAALWKLGKYGASKLGSLISGGKDLAAELKATTASKVGEELEKSGTRATTAENRADAASQIAERESKKGETAYGGMPGVTQATEAGVNKPIPRSMDDVGTVIRTETNKVYDNLKDIRSKNAEENKGEAFDFARGRELKGEKVEDTQAFKDVTREVQNLLKDPETKLSVATLDAIKNPLNAIKRALDPRFVDPETGVVMGEPVSFQGLEDLRRFLRDRSYGIPAEGFDAINQQKAGDLARSVEKVMSEFSEGRIDTFIKQYRKDSEPLRAFQTKVGKALVDEQLIGKGANYATVPAQSIPGKVFNSPEEYKALVDALGGNKDLSQQLAKQYFASKLEGIKDTRGVMGFIEKNRTMLEKTGAIDDAEKYAIALRNAENRGSRAAEMGKTRTATAKEQKVLHGELSRIQSDVQRATSIDEINSQATKAADSLQKSGVMSIEQRDQFLREVKTIVDAQKKKEMVNKIIKYGIYMTGIGYGATNIYGTITSK